MRLADITVHHHHSTEKGIKVSLTGKDRDAVWLPKDAVEVNSERGSTMEITLPENLALERGLI